jgi:aerobic-type carbon monoxide dehydrogenase small subunit (CoxS/CutS family)
MKLNCNINGSSVSLVVNSDKPLSFILRELIPTFSDNSQCLGAECGNCIVLLNGEAVLSCLIPAFRLTGCSITTFEGFRKTRFFHDIERAYTDIGNQPCPQCYASKTLLIEALLIKMDKELQNRKDVSDANRRSFSAPITTASANEQAARNRAGGGSIDPQVIAQEFAMCKCQCIELSEIEKIINLAYKYRSRRRARRS